MAPHAPPVAYPELAPVGGQIGPEPEDFQVDEVPLGAGAEDVCPHHQDAGGPAVLRLPDPPADDRD